MTPMIIPTPWSNRLLDYNQNEISIGDIFIIANARKHGDVSYATMLVTSRTKGMLRAMTVGTPDNVAYILSQVTEYAGQFKSQPRHKGALIAPWNTYKLFASVVSEKEINDAIATGMNQSNSNIQSNPFSSHPIVAQSAVPGPKLHLRHPLAPGQLRQLNPLKTIKPWSP